MTITATDGSAIAWGNIKFTPPFLTQTGTIHIDVANAVAEDVSGTITPLPGDLDLLYIAWCFYFYGTEILANSYRFKSALPKFDLGYADIAFRGSCTDSIYLNFLAQRSPNYVCFKNNGGTSYPSGYIAPVPISDPQLIFLPLTKPDIFAFDTNSQFTKYGTDLYLQFTGLQISDETECVIYYQSFIPPWGPPLSLGDI
jgi:hypothetical protein